MTQMTTCLIFGVNSFTGSYVKQVFEANGLRVVGTVHHNLGQASTDDLTHCVDITDEDAVNRVIESVVPDYVIHLAGISFVPNHKTRQFYDVHIVGSNHILKAVSRFAPKIKKIVLASTALIYGQTPHPNENSAPNPLNDYAVSKLSMEWMAKLWFDRLPIVVTRPFNCIGVGQSDHFLVAKILHAFVNRVPTIELGNLQIERDFIDIRQAAQIYYELTLHGDASQAYNIASGRSHAISDLIDRFERLSNHTIRVQHNPQFARAHDPVAICGDMAKTNAIVKSKCDYSLSDTLSWMYAHACRH